MTLKDSGVTGLSPQRSFQDVWRCAPRPLGLLGVSIASLKEQVDSEVKLAGGGSRGRIACQGGPEASSCPDLVIFAQRRQQLLAEASQLSATLGR